MSYRDDDLALSARCDVLATELVQKTRELNEARAMRDELRMRARRADLPNVRVAMPCDADWSSMPGDDRVRFCRRCAQNVFNLSALTRNQAEVLIEQHAGRLCVRYLQRGDGTIILRDCLDRRKRTRRRRVMLAGLAAAVTTGAVAAYDYIAPQTLGGYDAGSWGPRTVRSADDYRRPREITVPGSVDSIDHSKRSIAAIESSR